MVIPQEALENLGICNRFMLLMGFILGQSLIGNMTVLPMTGGRAKSSMLTLSIPIKILFRKGSNLFMKLDYFQDWTAVGTGINKQQCI